MINLLKETIEKLEENGKSTADVIWVGDKDAKTTWTQFAESANFEYNDGYGGEEISLDLLVVGCDFWLERHEYDGSEWWEFKTLPKEPDSIRTMVFSKSWRGFSTWGNENK